MVPDGSREIITDGELERVWYGREFRVILCAPLHVNDLPYQPLRPRVGLPQNSPPASKPLGRLRTCTRRNVFDGIFYILRSGYPWRLLAHDLPPWPTFYYHFRKFRLTRVWHLVFEALHTAERKRVGKDHDASATIIDSQSLKTTEDGVQSNGYAAHKNVKGPKRHLLVNTLSLLLSVYVTLANVQDRVAARLLLARVNPLVSRLKRMWVDGAYSSEKLARWCEERGGRKLNIVDRDRETEGFEMYPALHELEALQEQRIGGD
jgi:putative transposase